MVDLQTDTIIGFDDASAKLGVSRRTLNRWARSGVSGVHLEVAYLGRRRVTSAEAIQRFVDRLSEVRTGRQADDSPSRKERVRRARAECERLGV